MAARVAFERALQFDLDTSSGKNGHCTCIWCNGSGQRSCAWCGGRGIRNELESQSWDEISKNIGKKMNGEAIEMPERIPVRQRSEMDHKRMEETYGKYARHVRLTGNFTLHVMFCVA
jgi:hypothetical protein